MRTLATTKSLSERADEILAKRKKALQDSNKKVTSIDKMNTVEQKVTVADIDKAKAEKEKAEKSE
nr:MAG: hypothetical protein CM15mV30_1390 [uncultured marine virus]